LNDSVLSDNHNRKINYLRVSLTDRCNLKCIYCRPIGEIPRLKHSDILRYEEILRIINISSDLGVSKIRVTGGEPLLRKGVFGFLYDLNHISGIEDISLTTNGVFLSENIKKIKAVGIQRLNISLDSLDPRKFKKITGHDLFHQVWKGIEQAHALNFNPIKINVVALKGVNDDEFLSFAELTFSYPFHVRFIEHMPIGNAAVSSYRPLLSSEIKDIVSSIGKLVPVNKGLFDGPADRYRFEGAAGEIGFISPISHHFCETCNRLRLTASGHLRPCLLSDYNEDLKTPLRKGFSDNALAEIILRAVKNKPSQHRLSPNHLNPVSSQMSSIGG